MKWVSAVSSSKKADGAVRETVAQVRKSLDGERPHLLALFVTPHFEKDYKEIHREISAAFPSAFLIGCSGGGIIGGSEEVESRPAISLAAAVLPNVQIHPFRVEDDDIPDLDAGPRAWHKVIGVDPSMEPNFVILSDPFSIQIENFLSGMDFAYPKSVKVGGLASGAGSPGKNALFLNEEMPRSGLVGVALMGNVVIEPLVAQGCRPIGTPFSITACDRNVLLGLDGQPPLQKLQEIYDTLDPRDQDLLQHSLFLGIVSDSNGSAESDDFLIRNIVSADPQRGYLAVGALLRVGQSVQFHLRDAETSHQDLKHVLQRYSNRKSTPETPGSKGVLLFSCAGRGTHLYGKSNHDSTLFGQMVGDWPISGFFCNGEIGPVGKSTFVHGYTSCFGIVRAKEGV